MSLLAFLPSIIGMAGTLLGGKGKKQEYAAQQTPQQQAFTRYLMNLMKGQMGPGAANKQPIYDSMNMLSKMFGVGSGQYGQAPPPSGFPGMGMPQQGMPGGMMGGMQGGPMGPGMQPGQRWPQM